MPSPIITNYQIIGDDLKERLDVNANIEAAYLKADDSVNFEVIEKAASDSVSLNTGSSSTTSTSSVDLERLAECVGNYIVNEDDMETHSTTVDEPPPPPPPPSSSTSDVSDDQATQDAIAAADQRTADGEFALTHGGLTREQWDEFIRQLRDMGEIGNFIADLLEANPDKAVEILSIFLDPEASGILDGITQGSAYQERTQGTLRKMAEYIARNGYGFGNYWGWMLSNGQISIALEMLGLERVGSDFNGDGISDYIENGSYDYLKNNGYDTELYRDAEGNYYVARMEGDRLVFHRVNVTYNGEDRWGGKISIEFCDGAGDLSVDLSDPAFGLKDWQLALLRGASADEIFNLLLLDKLKGLGIELPPGCELPEGFDIENLGSDLKDFLLGWKNQMWVGTDDGGTDYIYVSEKFFELMKDLELLYNLKATLYLLANAKMELRKMVLEITTGFKTEASKYSLIDAAESERSLSSAQVRYQLYTLQRYVNSYNNKIYEELRTQARRDAIDEAEDSAWNWLNTIFTFGLGGAMNNDIEARFNRKMEDIERKRADFQARIEAKYEAAFGGMNFDAGDPFSKGIGDLVKNFTFDGTNVNVGDSKWDLDGNVVLETDVRLTAMQNLRRIWYTLQLAKAKLRKTVSEIVGGREGGGGGFEGVIMGAVDSAATFEKQAFQTLHRQMSAIVFSHNNMIDFGRAADEADEDWWISMFCTPLWILAPAGEALAGYLVDLAQAPYDQDANFRLTEVNVQQVLDRVFEDMSDITRNVLDSDAEAIRFINQLDAEMWGVVGELNDTAAVMTGDDDIQNIDESIVSGLRDKLVAKQNLTRAIVIFLRAKMGMRDMVAKIIRKTDQSTELIGSEALNDLGDSKRLAFELKLQNMTNRIQEHNNQVAESVSLKKAGLKFIMTLAAIILAAAGTVAGGLGAMAAISLFAAMTALGSSVSDLIFNATHPVDAGSFDQGRFYDNPQAKVTGDLLIDTYNNLDQQTREQVDSLSSDSHQSIGTNGAWGSTFSNSQWGLDSALLGEVNSTIQKMQNIQKILLIIAQTQQDIRSIVMASTSGVSTSDNADLVQSSHRADVQNRQAAYKLKQEMISDVVAAHNRAAAQDAAMEKAWISFGISIGSAVAGAALGGLNAFSDTSTWISGMMDGMFYGSLANAVINLAYSADEVGLNNGGLGTEEAIQEMIDNTFRVNRQSQLGALEQTAHDTVSGVSTSLVTDTGRGNVAVDSGAFARISQQLEKIFNSQIALATIAQALMRQNKMVARITGQATAQEDGLSLESVYQARDNAFRNLDILKQKVQEYADRQNQLNQLQRQLTMAVASAVMQAVSAYMKLDGDERLTEALNGAFGDEATITITEDPVAQQLMTGGSETWDGKLGVGDLVGVALNVVMSDNFAQLIATQIYDNLLAPSHSSNNSGKRVEGGKSVSRDSIDYFEKAAFQLEVETGELELEAEKLEIIQQLAKEFQKIMTALVKDGLHGLGRVRQDVDPQTAAVEQAGDLQSAESGSQADMVPIPVETTAGPDTLLPPEYTQKYSELMAQAVGNPEAAVALVRQLAELNRETFSAPEQQEAAHAALLLAAQELSQKIEASNMQSLGRQALSPNAGPQEKALALGTIAAAAENNPQVRAQFEQIVQEAALQLAQSELTPEAAQQLFAVAAEFRGAKEILTETLPSAVLLASAEAPAEGQTEPTSPITRAVLQLKDDVEVARQIAEEGGRPDLGLVRQDVLKLAQLLPQQEAGLNLQVIHDNVENYTPEQLLVVLEQIRKFTLSANERSLLDSAIQGLKNIQTQAAPASFAANFLQKVRSPQGTAEDLIGIFQAGTEEEKVSALARIRSALILNDGTIALAPEQQQRVAAFLGLVADLSQNPQIKQEARALYDEIAPRLPQEVESTTEAEAQIEMPQVSMVLDGVRQVEAGRVAILANGLPEERREEEEHRTQSTEHGTQGEEEPDRPGLPRALSRGFDPIFGGLGANQRIIEEHRQQVDSAALA
ncbi:hypothetical protein HZC35_04460 [Candidatus Saganbacteria bacterium]|nr:hypothetical protein [Candidatus Saganbacteria bacterium]